MTFDLSTILVFCIGAALYLLLLPVYWRGWTILVASILAAYWLQPRIVRVPYVDYALPTTMIALTVIVWWATRIRDSDDAPAINRDDLLTLCVILALVLGVAATRYLDADFRLTSRPPHFVTVFIGLGTVGAFIGIVSLAQRVTSQRRVLTALILLMIALFVVIKTKSLALEVARLWREGTGRDPNFASLADLQWLGFSYLAFRLIHALRDRQTGKLPALSLREFVTYALFFPAYTAGPIDRTERFVKDLRALPEMLGLDPARITEGLTRIAIGIFKKFIIADTLALGMSLSAANAMQIDSTPGLWIMLYGYALRLYFDFSGYSDIAIGIGILFGFKLPENFDRPYLKANITAFWQSWHMTLSNWARFYVFSPLSRFLLTRQPKPAPVVVVFSSQLSTMLVIGLWHGVSANFIVWGVWHGAGLFIHKQWSDRTRKWYRGLNDHPAQKRAWSLAGWFITFHFVVLGWVWFALSDLQTSLDVFRGLVGSW